MALHKLVAYHDGPPTADLLAAATATLDEAEALGRGLYAEQAQWLERFGRAPT